MSRQRQTQRYDIYARIHKALRLFMFDTLHGLGSAGSDDAQGRARALDQTRELLAFCASHLEHENHFIHPAMQARQPGSSQEIAEDHVQHLVDIERLQQLTGRVRDGEAEITELYRELALFVSHNLAHMNVEETEHNAVLWATHSDEELAAMEQKIVASLPPEEAMLCMRWMIPAMNHAERVETLAGARDHAPAPVYGALMGLARQTLSAEQWRALQAALELDGARQEREEVALG